MDVYTRNILLSNARHYCGYSYFYLFCVLLLNCNSLCSNENLKPIPCLYFENSYSVTYSCMNDDFK